MTKPLPPLSRLPEPPTTPDLSDRLTSIVNRLDAAYSAAHTPRFSVWHGLGLALGLMFMLVQQYAPGLSADLGRIVLVGPEFAVLARVTTVLLCGVALFWIRSMHPTTALGLWLNMLAVMFRLGEVRVLQEPLTLAYALALLGICTVAIRVIVRPNETDQIYVLKAELEQLKAALDGQQQGGCHDCTSPKN